jgi:hypothetical protein
LQSPDLILEDQTKPKIAEPSPGATARSVHYVASSAQGKEAGPVPEGRSHPSGRPGVEPMPTLKGPLSEGPGRVARFTRAMLRTTATLLILAVALLTAALIWDYYVTAPWTRDGSVRVTRLALSYHLDRARRALVRRASAPHQENRAQLNLHRLGFEDSVRDCDARSTRAG